MNPTATPEAPVSTTIDPALQDLWLPVLKKMEPTLQRGQFITWFKDTAVLGLEEGTLVIGLPLPMFLSWHMEHYRAQTLQIAQELEPSVRQIVYNVDTALRDNP